MGLIQSIEHLNRIKRLVRKNSFSLTVFELEHGSSPAFGLRINLEFPSLVPLGLQIADGTSWDFSSSMTLLPVPYGKSLYIYVYISCSVSWENPD